MNRVPDEVIIKQLASTDTVEGDKALTYLYQRMYTLVKRFVLNNNGAVSDVDDIFQDGLVAFYKLARRGKLHAQINVEAYLYSICRNMWLKQLKKSSRESPISEEMKAIPVEESIIRDLIDEERRNLLDKVLEKLGSKCKKILLYFYYDRLSMKEVSQKMDYANEQVAKNKKSACMKKLRTLIQELPTLKNDLK
ncbi:MAG: sigma-70 family RNA polymerase sigma factor [Bacteroidota bacterium]